MNRKEKAVEFENESYAVHVTGRHIEVSDTMRDYVIEKLTKLEKIADRIIEVNVIMEVQKLEHHVEIVMKTGNHRITSQGCSTDMYASIDMAIKKLEAQLLHAKSKSQDHHLKK